MPAARYWRVEGITVDSGSDLELYEFALYTDNTRVDPAATINSTFSPVSGTLSNLQDASNLTSVKFDKADLRSPAFAINWDFGSAVEITKAAAFPLTIASSPNQFTLSALINDVWTVIAIVNGNYTGSPPVIQSASDVYYENVILLDCLDGRLLTKSEFYPYTVSTNGTVQQNSGRFGFYYFSSIFRYVNIGAGTNSAASLTWPIADTFNDDFTIEGFFNFAAPAAPLEVNQSLLNLVGGYSLRYTILSAASFPTSTISLFNPAGTSVASTTVAAANTAVNGYFFHAAVTRSSGTIRFFLDGAVIATISDSSPVTFTSIIINTNRCEMFIDSVRVTKNVARYTAAFTKPTPSQPFTYRPARTVLSLSNSSSPATIGTFTPYASAYAIAPNLQAASVSTFQPYPQAYANAQSLSQRLELIYGGAGVLVGNVKKQALPADIPISRKVRLYSDTRLVRETWSEPVTGNFTFNELSKECIYTAISYDYENNYRALISDKLRAV
jgi:hypothetical protein